MTDTSDQAVPNVVEITRARTDNLVYEDEDLKIFLDVQTSKGEFHLTLDIEGRRQEQDVRLEITISLERHKEGQGHASPHIQVESFSTDQVELKNGRLHITLPLENPEQLTDCAEGFMYYISEVLKDLGQKSSKPLHTHFFYASIERFGPKKAILQNRIKQAFEDYLLSGTIPTPPPIEFKGRKGEQLEISDPFILLSVLKQLRLLDKLTIEPLVQTILKIPRIKSALLGVDTTAVCEKVVQHEWSIDTKYNENEFLKSFRPL